MSKTVFYIVEAQAHRTGENEAQLFRHDELTQASNFYDECRENTGHTKDSKKFFLTIMYRVVNPEEFQGTRGKGYDY